MSGAYVLHSVHPSVDFHELARVLSAQLAWGHETIDHYAVADRILLGLVSPDCLKQGIMPRYLEQERLWVLLAGTLYESDFLSDWHKKNPGVATGVDLFGKLYRSGDLLAALPDLNGAFFLIVWDPEADTLVAANDRFALYPMYWAGNAGQFCLASRVLCSVLAGVVEGRWDPSGVAQVLTTNDFAGDITLVEGVSAYPAATLLVKRPGQAPTWSRYWQFDYTPRHADLGTVEIGRELGDRFKRAVLRQCRGADRIGVTLSGGLDSRSIVAAASIAGVPLKTFTWGKADSLDRQFARQVGSVFGTEHLDCDYEFRNVEYRDDETARVAEGFTNIFDTHMLAHIHVLQGNADLILNGFAGDLILGGSYLRRRWMREIPDHELASILFAWRNGIVPEADLARAMVDPGLIPEGRRPSEIYARLLANHSTLSTPDRVDRFFLENRVRRHTSTGTVLMRCAVESAACFFDYELVDFMTGIPAPLRRDHRAYIAMMTETFPAALRVRWQRTLLRPHRSTFASILARGALKACRTCEQRIGWPHLASRQSPVDFSVWLRGPLRGWMTQVCHDDYPVADEVLRPSFCSDTWRRHLGGSEETTLLGTIASLRGFSRALGRARRGIAASPRNPTEVGRQTRS